MKRTVFISLFIFLALSELCAQMDRVSTFVNIKGSETINYESEIPMMVVEPLGDRFNPEDLIFAYPELEIDSMMISIEHPNLASYVDTLYMMVFVKDRAYSRKGNINIIIIGVVDQNTLDYYIDNNSDYVYDHEESRFTFTPGVEKTAVNLDSGREISQFFLFNPIYDPPLYENLYVFEGSWNEIGDSFSLLVDISGSFGSGKGSVSYSPNDTGIDMIEYSSDITSFGLFRLGLIGRYKGVNLGFYAGFEQVQYSERNKFIYRDGTSPSISYMSGLWMWSKVSLEANLEIDVKLSNRVMIGPSFSYGIWTPVDGRKFDPDLYPPEDARYIDSWKYEYGGYFKFLVNNTSYFKVKAGKIVTNVDVREFLPEYNSGYDQKYEQFFLSLGYTFLLNGSD